MSNINLEDKIREAFEEIENYIENLENMSNGPDSLPAIACGEIRDRIELIESAMQSAQEEIERLNDEKKRYKEVLTDINKSNEGYCCCGDVAFDVLMEFRDE